MRVVLTDRRGVEPHAVELFYEGGISAFVRYLDRSKQPVLKEPILIKGERDGITVDAPCGGTTAIMKASSASPTAFPSEMVEPISRASRGALTRVINNYATVWHRQEGEGGT